MQQQANAGAVELKALLQRGAQQSELARILKYAGYNHIHGSHLHPPDNQLLLLSQSVVQQSIP
jgi:predicted membrane chloride channel (bestrophin family)